MNKYKKKKIEKETDGIKGIIIYYLRKKYGWSLEKLSNEVDISLQYLSDVENGRKVINDSFFQEVLDCFNVQFNVDSYVEKSVLDLTMKSFEDYLVFGDKESLAKLYHQLEDETLIYSYAFPHVYIWKCCLNMFLNSDYIYDDYLIHNLKYLFTCDEFALFHCFFSEKYIEKRCFKKAKEYLELAKNIVSSTNVRNYIYYKISIVLVELNSLDESIKYSEIAMQDAWENGTFSILKRIQFNLANYYAKARNFEQAHQMFERIKRLMKFIKDDELYLICLRNEVATYQDQGDYSKSNELGLRYLMIKSDDKLVLYLMAINYFLLDKYEECNEFIQRMDKLNIESQYILRWINILKEGMKDKDSKEYCLLLKNHYELAKKEETVNEQIFILKLLIDYFERNKMYKKLSDYQRELLNLIK